EGSGGLVTPDQFDKYIDIGVEDDVLGAAAEDIFDAQLAHKRHGSALVTHHGQHDRSTGFGLNNRAAFLKHLDDADTDRAKADEPQADRLFHLEGTLTFVEARIFLKRRSTSWNRLS